MEREVRCDEKVHSRKREPDKKGDRRFTRKIVREPEKKGDRRDSLNREGGTWRERFVVIRRFTQDRGNQTRRGTKGSLENS